MSAVDFAIGPSLEIVIVGEDGADDTEAMLAGLRGQYLPNKIVLLRTPGDDATITDLAEFTRYQYVSFAQNICRKSKHIVQFICTMIKEIWH